MSGSLRLVLPVLAGCLLGLQLAVLSGCATLPAQRPEIPAAEVDGRMLLEEWLRSPRPGSLQGVAKVKLQTPERSLSGTQVLLAETPDRLRAETLSPFGTPLMVMAANGSELAVLVPGDNRFYQGRTTPENLGRFTRLPLRLAELVNILLFRPPRIAYQQLQTSPRTDGGWLVVLEAGPRRQELHFDAGRRLIGVAYLYDEELQLRLAYGEFAAEPLNLPRRIELVLPLQRTEVSLTFKELEVDRPFLPGVFTLVAPPGAMVTNLDETAMPSDGAETGAASAEGSPLLRAEGE
jgi:hypothetical protein